MKRTLQKENQFKALIVALVCSILGLSNAYSQVTSTGSINGAFTVELGNYIADSDIDYWIYGHSHRNIDAQIGKTKILSNQLGYISHGEFLRNGFKLGRMIEV